MGPILRDAPNGQVDIGHGGYKWDLRETAAGRCFRRARRLLNHEPPVSTAKLIVSHPAIKLGRPVVDGTRVAVDEILDAIAGGASPAQVAAAHPGLDAEGVHAALRFAADALRFEFSLENRPALELHGAHVVSLPPAAGGEPEPAVAVRAFHPEAIAISVEPWGAAPGDAGADPGAHGKTWFSTPMEKIHPEGVFEAIFPGRTEPFAYRLQVTGPDGKSRIIHDPHGLPPRFTPEDLPRFGGSVATGPIDAGTAEPARRQKRVYGAHPARHAGLDGVAFAVWAPGASEVSVVGDFNRWDLRFHPMRPIGQSGSWELFVPGVAPGARYKYRIASARDGRRFDKADPYGYAMELRPATASIVWDLGRYAWKDGPWLKTRRRRQKPEAPMAIYEVHLGSWRRAGEPGGATRWLTYRELADQLVPYVKEMGFTHIEPMPVAEHPFDGSWGYQITGFFAPTSRYGSPDDFRFFVDRAHEAGLGVILDWVPGHFPKDEHGLALFDGTPLYEHPDPRRSENLEWGTSAFNLDRPEVAAFLLSNALFWIEEYHVDGLRVDAVSSMIYLDYSRRHWVPNALGGRENLEAAAFLRRLNEAVHARHPGVLTIAEESSAWPNVTGCRHPESLGFDLKWNLGWMHDTLGYLEKDPIYRSHHHRNLTFSLMYAFSERFVLPFSHDEVVHGKRSLLSKMPGNERLRFANLRAAYGYLYAHPGKKLLFMGAEFGALEEWNQDAQLDWTLPEREPHRGLRRFVADLNRFYRDEPALHRADFGWKGFQWIDCEDSKRSLVSFVRREGRRGRFVVVAANFTPVAREGYRLGVPEGGLYAEALNSDAGAYGGSGAESAGPLAAEPVEAGGQPFSLSVTLPPLAVVYFRLDDSRACT
ncbi:MAG: 1,4-alpha-glucan branching protein GlgB [Opitutaceae bacterium]